MEPTFEEVIAIVCVCLCVCIVFNISVCHKAVVARISAADKWKQRAQPHPTYLSTLKICRVELCTELFQAIIPTLFLCFLLIWYPYISLHF